MSELKEEIEKVEEIQKNDSDISVTNKENDDEIINEISSKEIDDSIQDISNEDKIVKLENDLKESQENYLRVHADFDNIKKRLEKEKYKAIDYASEKFAKDLLASIDSLEMAILSSNNEKLDAPELLIKLKEGVELTLKNFQTVFQKHDIQLVDTDNSFDPNFHEAIMKVEDEKKEEGAIVQVMQKGYTLKNRLLRPAMVSICKK